MVLLHEKFADPLNTPNKVCKQYLSYIIMRLIESEISSFIEYLC